MAILTRAEKQRLKEFEKQLGYRFKKKELLQRALTHKSSANERRLGPLADNERLEYLGDAVLELSVSHMLMERFPETSEGALSKWRAAVVNEEVLARLSREIGLGEVLCLGKGEEQTGGRKKPSLLSDAFEAVLGAIYLDRGFNRAFAVIQQLYKDAVERVGQEGFKQDYKTRLQEVVQGKFRTVPRYMLVSSEGPDHSKTFEIHLYIQDEFYSQGMGASKKAAEQDAAKGALKVLENNV